MLEDKEVQETIDLQDLYDLGPRQPREKKSVVLETNPPSDPILAQGFVKCAHCRFAAAFRGTMCPYPGGANSLCEHNTQTMRTAKKRRRGSPNK